MHFVLFFSPCIVQYFVLFFPYFVLFSDSCCKACLPSLRTLWPLLSLSVRLLLLLLSLLLSVLLLLLLLFSRGWLAHEGFAPPQAVTVVVVVVVVLFWRFSSALLLIFGVRFGCFIVFVVQGERGHGLLGQQGPLRRGHRHTLRPGDGPEG